MKKKVITPRKVKDAEDAAVFARNHWVYLVEAAGRGKSARTTFRASAKWKSAWIALNEHGPRQIYFSPIDPPKKYEGPLVTHQATLHSILLLDEIETHLSEPEKNPEVKLFLENELDTTKEEELWGGNVSTLYEISGCNLLEKPFYYTDLIKIGDEAPIDEKFNYSYSICHAKKET